MYPVNPPFYVKSAYIILSVLGIGYIAIIGQKIIAPLLFAFLFCILLIPIANFFENKCRLSRMMSSLISVILLVIAISAVLFLFGSQLSLLFADWPMLRQRTNSSFHNLQSWVEAVFHVDAKQQIVYLENAAKKILETTASVVSITILTLSSALVFNILILLLTFFLLLYRSTLTLFLLSLFKDEQEDTIYKVIERVKHIVNRYVVGLFMQMGIITGITSIVFLILNVKYAMLFGLITGVFNIIPYLGILFALVLSIVITFAAGTAGKVLIVLITIIAVHTLDGNFLMPLIVGSRAKINPFIIFIGLIVGEMMWGVSGMFLCIPYIAILKIICDHVDKLHPLGILLGERVSMKENKSTGAT